MFFKNLPLFVMDNKVSAYGVTILTAKTCTSEGFISDTPFLKLFMMPNHSAPGAVLSPRGSPRSPWQSLVPRAVPGPRAGLRFLDHPSSRDSARSPGQSPVPRAVPGCWTGPWGSPQGGPLGSPHGTP